MTTQPSDTLVQVGGLHVEVRITGSGTPPLVMLSSSGGAHEQWEQLRAQLSDTTSLTYGRPGLAGSDPLPPDQARTLRTVEWAAEHLHQMLRAAGLPAPYVLSGCSIGGWIADRFAALWPDEVAGLVQIDPTMLTLIPKMEWREAVDDADGAGILFARQDSQQELLDNPPPPPRRAVVISRAFGTVSADIVARYWQPLTVAEVDHGWRVCQREWARRLAAVHVAADTAGHHVQVDQPALVAYVMRAVLIAARADADLLIDPAELGAAGGRRLDDDAADADGGGSSGEN